MEDLSSNGTFVNGELAPRSKPKKLNSGDVISLPGYEIKLERRALPPAPRPVIPGSAGTKLKISDLSFSTWELIVLVSAISSFVLIIYYLTR